MFKHFIASIVSSLISVIIGGGTNSSDINAFIFISLNPKNEKKRKGKRKKRRKRKKKEEKKGEKGRKKRLTN